MFKFLRRKTYDLHNSAVFPSSTSSSIQEVRVNGTAIKGKKAGRGSAVGISIVLRGTRVYTFAKQTDRITRYYDCGLSLSFFPMMSAKRFVQQHSINRITWRDNEPGRLSVFALLSNAHSRHNGCCQGAFQFFSEEGRGGERQDSLLGYIYV